MKKPHDANRRPRQPRNTLTYTAYSQLSSLRSHWMHQEKREGGFPPTQKPSTPQPFHRDHVGRIRHHQSQVSRDNPFKNSSLLSERGSTVPLTQPSTRSLRRSGNADRACHPPTPTQGYGLVLYPQPGRYFPQGNASNIPSVPTG